MTDEPVPFFRPLGATDMSQQRNEVTGDYDEHQAAEMEMHEQAQRTEWTETFIDCPAFTPHELTARTLETAERVSDMSWHMQQEVEALEQRVGQQYGEWTAFMNNMLDKMVDRVRACEMHEDRVNQMRQEHEAHIRAMNEAHMRQQQALEQQIEQLAGRIGVMGEEWKAAASENAMGLRSMTDALDSLGT